MSAIDCTPELDQLSGTLTLLASFLALQVQLELRVWSAALDSQMRRENATVDAKAAQVLLPEPHVTGHAKSSLGDVKSSLGNPAS
jgi:hypothetical protein